MSAELRSRDDMEGLKLIIIIITALMWTAHQVGAPLGAHRWLRLLESEPELD